MQKELEVIWPAYFPGIPPELAAVWCDRLDGPTRGSPAALRENSVCLGKGLESTICCPGFRHPSVVLLLECQMGVNPDARPACRLCFELCEPVAQ